MAFVFSPSNMSTYQQCPRKFEAQSLTKEIKWQATKQKSRGTLVHNAMEKAMKDGYDAVRQWPDGMDMDFVRQRVDLVRQMVAMGCSLHIEHELVINRQFQSVDWWDENALLRAKADAIIIPPTMDTPISILDIKTGKKWDEEDFQLRAECLLAHAIYKHPVVQYAYWYVDSGEIASGLIDFRNGIEPVRDIVELMNEMGQAIAANNFEPRENRFCKWCGLYKTPGCGL